MYTCDICGIQVGSTEDLLRVNMLDQKLSDKFYGVCDLLVDSDCYDRNSNELTLVSEEEIEAYEQVQAMHEMGDRIEDKRARL